MRHRRTKRRTIRPWSSDKSPASVARRACYVGSAEHKAYPSPAGPPALRSDTTRCDASIPQAAINTALAEGIRRRCVGDAVEQGFPSTSGVGSKTIFMKLVTSTDLPGLTRDIG